MKKTLKTSLPAKIHHGRTSLKRVVYLVLIFFILIVCLLSFLLSTTPGMYTAVTLANRFLPGKLILDHPSGRLANAFHARQLLYQEGKLRIVMNNVTIHWHPFSAFFRHRLVIQSLKAEQIDIILKENSTENKKSFGLKPLPFDLSLMNLKVAEFGFQNDNAHHIVRNLSLKAELTQKAWRFYPLQANYKDIIFTLFAEVVPSYPYPLKAKLDFQAASKTNIALRGQLGFNGDFHKLLWQGEFKEPKTLRVFGSLQEGNYLENIFKWKTLQWPFKGDISYKSGIGRMEIKGTLPELTLHFNSSLSKPLSGKYYLYARRVDNTIVADSIIRLSQGIITGQLRWNPKRGQFLEGSFMSPSLDASQWVPGLTNLSFQTNFSAPSLAAINMQTTAKGLYYDHPIIAKANLINNIFKAHANLGSNKFDLTGTSLSQWEAFAKIPQPDLLHPLLHGLHSNLTLKASFENEHQGSVSLAVEKGYFLLSGENPLKALQFHGGTIKGLLNPKGFTAKGALTIDPQKSLILALDLPGFSLKKRVTSEQKIRNSLKLQLNSLDFLKKITKDLEQTQGKVTLHLLTTGTFKNPATKGNILLEQGQAYLPKLGIHLSGINARLQSNNKAWQLQTTLQSQNRPLILRGQGEFFPQFTGNLSLVGENVPLVNLPNYKINASPNLVLEIKPDLLDIKGSLTIPEGFISPQTFTESVTLPDDVVFADKKEQRQPERISADISVIMGKNVRLELKGLKGFLDGSLQIKQHPQGVLKAAGSLSLRDGLYKAYGQELTVEEGELLFTGGVLANPGINIKAVRQFSDTNTFSGSNQLFDFNNSNLQNFNFNKMTVGIEISGRLNAPKIQLFSRPATLTQADILSMLILGRPANQANKAGGQLLLAAISAMNLDEGTKGAQLLHQLKESTGLEFNIQTSTVYNRKTNTVSDSTGLVIGKSLSKRLYISYNIGILQSESEVWTLKYLLNKFFSIQVTASDSGNGLDFLYTHSM